MKKFKFYAKVVGFCLGVFLIANIVVVLLTMWAAFLIKGVEMLCRMLNLNI